MLERIHIHNIGIIEDVELEFDNGINVLTGETGSGKSLIIDSISLVTGNRLSKDVIRNGADEAFIEVCFNANIPDISDDDTVILSRKILSSGKNVCKINGQMATLTELKNIGDILIDIHGQHDVVNLLDKSKHIELLDGYIGIEMQELKKAYSELLKQRKEIIKKQIELTADPIERNRKIDLLKYELDEITNANLKEDEEESLIEKKSFFQNAEKICKALSEVHNILDENIVGSLNSCVQSMSNISGYKEEYSKICATIEESYYNLEEASRDVFQILNEIEYNEEEKQQVFDRLDEIFKLKRKYGNSITEILEYADKVEMQLNELNASNEYILTLQKDLKENSQKLFDIALKIHNLREKNAKNIQDLVQNELVDLEMPKAKFEIDVRFFDNSFEFCEDKEYIFGINGLDDVEFMICTNIGSKFQSISKIASGGELSRLTLALKIVFAHSYNIPTIIFDEIDTGLSGQACVALAQKFKEISKLHQIILISHHANIAAIGNNNIFVKKVLEDGLIKTKANVLNIEDKIEEIARILSGNEKTDIALKHAKELVKLNQ